VGAHQKRSTPSLRYREALERARKAGRPLLVLIIPDDDGEKWERGRAFGEWLNHGTDAQLAPLALVEVACLRLDELERVYDGPSDPLMLLIDPSEQKPMQILNATLPRYADRYGIVVIEAGGQSPKPPDDETVFGQRVGILARLVGDAVAPGPLPAERTHALAERAKTKLRDRPPPGAHWASSSGCGTSIEQTPEEKAAEERELEQQLARGIIAMKTMVSVGCGMGHVPEKSSRFLYLFSKPPP
jgi:hypothetical protein